MWKINFWVETIILHFSWQIERQSGKATLSKQLQAKQLNMANTQEN